MDEVGVDAAQPAREAQRVARRLQHGAQRHAAGASRAAAQVARGRRQRQHLDGDPGLLQACRERPVLAEDDVGVDALEMGQQPQQRDLCAGEPRDVVEVDDPQALARGACSTTRR